MIRYYQVELPAKVKAFTTCRDGDYSIVVNSILSREQQLEEIRHELQHIAGNDDGAALRTIAAKGFQRGDQHLVDIGADLGIEALDVLSYLDLTCLVGGIVRGVFPVLCKIKSLQFHHLLQKLLRAEMDSLFLGQR